MPSITPLLIALLFLSPITYSSPQAKERKWEMIYKNMAAERYIDINSITRSGSIARYTSIFNLKPIENSNLRSVTFENEIDCARQSIKTRVIQSADLPFGKGNSYARNDPTNEVKIDTTDPTSITFSDYYFVCVELMNR